MSKFYRKLITGTPSYTIPGIYSVKEHRYTQSTNFGRFGGLVPITYLVVGGGGKGSDGDDTTTFFYARPGGGGGGGGVATNDYTDPIFLKATSGTVIITVGAGQTYTNYNDIPLVLNSSISGGNLNINGLYGGMGGGTLTGAHGRPAQNGGSGGGSAPAVAAGFYSNIPGIGLQSTSTSGGFGNNGGRGLSTGTKDSFTIGGAGGGGGGGAPGGDSDIGLFGQGGAGGDGYTTSIITTSQATILGVGEVVGDQVYFSGGGGGGDANYLNSTFYLGTATTTGGTGGKGGGGYYFVWYSTMTGGTSIGATQHPSNFRQPPPNTGGGGYGGKAAVGNGNTFGLPSTVENGPPGGSGVVIIKYPDYYPAAALAVSATVLVENGYRIYTWKTSGTFRIDL